MPQTVSPQGSEADTDEDNAISPHEFDDVVEDTEPTETEPPETLPEGTVVLELDQDEVVADGWTVRSCGHN